MDRSTPNLPSRDFSATSSFYSRLGFEEDWRDDEWMILRRGDLWLEFFPHPEIDPAQSWFSCCLRLDDVATFYGDCLDAGIPEGCRGHPRIQPPTTLESGLTISALVDPDGTLLRLIQNRSAGSCADQEEAARAN